jgi:hypothetical protein
MFSADCALARSSIVDLGRIVVKDAAGPGARADRLYHEAWFMREIAEALQLLVLCAIGVIDRDDPRFIDRLVINTPPQHGKSLHCSELMPAWALGVEPDLRILTTAYNAELAKRAVENARKWMNTDAYKATFATRIGRYRRDDDGQSSGGKSQSFHFDAMNSRSNRLGGYYRAIGLGGGTGWPADLIIIDDLIRNYAEALSDAHETKRRQFVMGNLDSRNPRAVVYVGTRWADGETSAWLVEHWRAEGRSIRVLNFPAIYDPAYSVPYDRRTVPGEGLWLDGPKWGQREYDARRAGLEKSAPMLWAALYLGRPMLLSGELFAARHVKRFNPNEWDYLNKIEELFLSIDGNLTETGDSAAAIGVWGILDRTREADGVHFFRLDEGHGHWSLPEFVATVRALWIKWSGLLPDAALAGRILIENRAVGPALASILREDGIAFELVPKDTNKLVCYRLAQVPWSSGRVWIPSASDGNISNDWVGTGEGDFLYLHDLAKLPRKPDDRGDETAQILIYRDTNLGPKLLGRVKHAA